MEKFTSSCSFYTQPPWQGGRHLLSASPHGPFSTTGRPWLPDPTSNQPHPCSKPSMVPRCPHPSRHSPAAPAGAPDVRFPSYTSCFHSWASSPEASGASPTLSPAEVLLMLQRPAACHLPAQSWGPGSARPALEPRLPPLLLLLDLSQVTFHLRASVFLSGKQDRIGDGR